MHHSTREEPRRFGVNFTCLKASLHQGRVWYLPRRRDVVGAEAPGSPEHPNAGGAAGGHSGFPWHSSGVELADVTLNCS